MTEIETPAAAPKVGAATGELSRPLAVHLRSMEGEPLDGALGRLARVFGLDTFSTSRLDYHARLEMKAAALVLLVVFCFDFLAWSLLFNTILQTELLAIGVWSLAALFAGLLFSAMVVLYERQFLTTDVSLGWRRLALPTAIRFAVILSSAFVTAQPVELLFFRQPVFLRSHQEGIRLEVATRREHLRKLERLQAEQERELAEVGDKLRREPEFARLERAQADLADAVHDRDVAEVQRAQAARSLVGATAEESRLRGRVGDANAAWLAATRQASGPEDEAVARAKQELDGARSALAAATARRQGLADTVTRRTTEVAVGNERIKRGEGLVGDRVRDLYRVRDQLRGRIEKVTGELHAERERVDRWVRRLRELTPKQLRQPETVEVLPAGAAPRTVLGATVAHRYRVPAYDFFEQLRVLGDLRRGDPPLWNGVSTDAVAELAEAFSLADPQLCEEATTAAGDRGAVRQQPASVQPPPRAGAGQSPTAAAGAGGCDPLRSRRQAAATSVYRYSYWVVYAIALVIPLMVFATKLLMAPELKSYYSVADQARAGNAEALRLQGLAAHRGGRR